MVKTIVVADSSFDWLSRRAGPRRTVALVLAETIRMIEKYEKDLAKFQAWVDASEGNNFKTFSGPLPERPKR